MAEIKIELTINPKEKPSKDTALGFGRIFTDHMFLMNYDEGQGWHSPRIVPYGPFSLSPAAMCLHYGQEVFEGLKAYKTKSGKTLLFRPEKNMERLNVSNDRLCIPLINEEFAVEAIKQLVKIEDDWIPSEEGTSLYLRPFIFATDPFIGVHPAHHLIFAIICSPVGAYYPEGLNPVKIYVEENYVRSVKGGMGFTKTAGNYAASLKAQDESEKLGYTQVLWLDGIHRKYIEEVGTMNVFFVIGDKIVTPSLQGSILSGITRMSSIELLRSWGYDVEERALAIDEVAEAYKNGQLKEAFGTGTAAVVSPIGELKWGNVNMQINNKKIGSITQKLYDNLTGIQWGEVEDTLNWTTEVK
ncbi:branched-chain-amino-acid aminotransferase 2 [Clostridia bacterium]|nr:branched-chain-amino-acid aminotransferase 2 [Clostridia bacterium]